MSDFTVGQRVKLAKAPDMSDAPSALVVLFGSPDVGEEGVVSEVNPVGAPEGAVFVEFDNYGEFGCYGDEIEGVA